ncbi:dihydrolipoyl dehydrogenase [Haloarchaeobius sp. TZWSO28]|uniref:dihydrolipoyl dehydrogenase n=1 Tax=Haloarchaeobius sp. TZWSO28 TaxID=3446119 RepID=UPI003EB74D5A
MSSVQPEQTELLVIGAGPGGYVAAIRAAQNGLDVTLADADAVGGTCLNYGCIPSKALISATDRVHQAGVASEMGIYSDPYVDIAELAAWKDGVVDRLTSGVEGLCKQNDVSLIKGHVTFETECTARAETADGTLEIEFENAIIATGSRPMTLDGFDVDDGPILDSRQALELSTVPSKLVVVGGGYIGMELGTVFRKLGAEVTVVEMLDQVLPGYDAELAAAVEQRADELGIELRFGQAVKDWEHDGEHVSLTAVDADENEYEYDCEAVLVAVGREPVTDSLGLDSLEVELTEQGVVPTDSTGKTPCEGIYAVGDVAGEPMLAHKASMEGMVAADAVAGMDVTREGRSIPAVVFTDPEVATVGLSATEARERGFDPVTGRFPLSANGRALSLDTDEGFVRLVAAADSGRLLGAAIVGPEASELIAEPTLAIQNGLTIADIADTVHAHPTLSEAVMESAEDVFGTPIHWPGT